MKISKTQAEVLSIMYEGSCYIDIHTGEVLLEDGDGNTYCCRKDTFKKLKSLEFISLGICPSMQLESYGVTRKGWDYVRQHYPNVIEHLI